MRSYLSALILVLCLPAFPMAKKQKPPQQREVKVQKTSLSRDQELQLGKEAATEVERTMEVLKNPEAEAWLNKIGQRLAQTPQANAYPYYFKLVNDDSINAFALPGGPMFVHTGLIKAAENEAQVAGVLAHEMSHIALRHGANQMSKAQTWQMIGGLVGAAAGMMSSGGQCGLLCQAVQLGGGLGVNSVLMKFSRDHERDADLNGARMMAAAGYNPIELARFFEKLEAQAGSQTSKFNGLANFMSSHPSPGNRVQYVSEDVQFYPKRSYDYATGNFASVQRVVAAVPPPKKKPAALLQATQGSPRQNIPQGFKDLQTQGFAIAYPGNWQAGQGQQGGGIIIAPQGGAAQGQNGGVELILGAMIDYYQPAGDKIELASTTTEFLNILKKGDANMRIESTTSAQIGGKPALMTKLTTKTSYQQEPDQVVFLYTVVRANLLWNLAVAAPPSAVNDAEPLFRQMTQTVQFPD